MNMEGDKLPGRLLLSAAYSCQTARRAARRPHRSSPVDRARVQTAPSCTVHRPATVPWVGVETVTISESQIRS